jgi:hypothetical protein
VKERQEVLVSKFCKLMTEDMFFKSHNEYRVGFYKEVILEVNIRILHHFSDDDRAFQLPLEEGSGAPKGPKNSPSRYIDKEHKKVQGAAENLCRFIDPHRMLDRDKGP